MTARLALVGVPGSGKTTLGAALADSWGCAFLDTDEVYEQQHGKPVSEAVIDDEADFRRSEEVIVRDCLDADGVVVAVGSGAIDAPSVRQALADCPVVWLDLPVSEAARRNGLSAVQPVPLGNVRAQFLEMLQKRADQYGAVADLRLRPDGGDAAQLLNEIIAWEADNDAHG